MATRGGGANRAERPRQKSWVEDGAVRIKAPAEADGAFTDEWLHSTNHIFEEDRA